MIAEIIAIGSEIVSGAKLDTNSQWLSQRLGELGVDVRYHTSLADDLAANTAAVKLATERADLVILSGGLGPTLDDLTRQAMADAAGVPLALDLPSLEHVESMFRRRSRSMPERNRIQAMFPQGSQPLTNSIGTAPGIWQELPRPNRTPCLLAALPGVPSELKRMFFDQVAPRIPATGVVIRHARIHCFGCGESQADELLGDLTARGCDPEIGITAHDATITLRIQAVATDEAICFAKIARASEQIRTRLGAFVFGTEDDELEDVVLAALHQRGETLSVIDCGTRGWLSQVLAESRNSGDGAFKGCLTTCTQADAARAAGLNWQSDSAPFGLEMLGEVCRVRFQSTYAIVVDAVPNLATDELAASTQSTEIALIGPSLARRVSVSLGGDPAILSARLGKAALDLLRRLLTEPADKTDLA
jgi:nicotinamide-nucleotide amidase